MCERSFILNVCFLIALVSTNPIPQEVDVQTYPGNYCDQSAFRNSLIGLFNEEQMNDQISNNIGSICSNYQNNILLKIIHDRIISNPTLVDIINDIQRSNSADILNNNKNPKSTPNIVNNYIIIPDLYNGQASNIKEQIYKVCPLNSPNICKRVKKNADKIQDDLGENTNYKQTDVEVTKGKENQFINDNQNNNETTNIQKKNTRKRLKRPPEAKSESTQGKIDNRNIDSIDLLVSENSHQRVNKTTKSKIKTTNEMSSKDKPIISEVTENSQKEKKEVENTIKNQQNKTSKTTSRKKINGVRLKHGNLINGKTKTLKDGGQKKKSKEIQPNKDDSKNKQKMSDSNRSRNAFNSVPITQDYQFPNMPYDSNSMYKYINALMSNYQSGNNDFKDFPFNFSNFYQLPPLSNPRSGKKPGRKSYKRRKHPKFYRRRNNRKRIYSRRKQLDKMVTNEPINDIISSSKNEGITSLNSLEIKEYPSITNIAVTQNDNETAVTENVSKQKENISSDENEQENFVTSIFNESLINNSLPEETLYNPYPSFIVGIDDKVPIIFENSLMDDYYPDFTADEALQLTTEETNPIKYHGDKYHYVSNKKINFGDFIKKRKRIAMKNMNKNSNLFFSESEVMKNISLNQEDNETKEKITGAQKSPHFLDNPDFRTRKIDSNEIYEPYHYHNIYQDPEEGYNKYDIEDTAVVYSSPMSDKNNVKTKSCNIEDGLAKWRKNKDSNVETVHARSKLAKYGLAL